MAHWYRLFGFILVFLPALVLAQPVQLLNVSYDPTRELYKDINPLFIQSWKQKTGQDLTINQSHGGSGTQAKSVIEGLAADVVSLALAYDIDAISQSGLIKPNWRNRLPHQSAPYVSTIVFVVRKGNPRKIKDWSDLIKEGVQIISPNPKTGGGARWVYLAAWNDALKQNNNSQEAARSFVKSFYQHVKVLDTAARGSSTTFAARKIGDVLVTWENEAFLLQDEFKNDQLEIVVPPRSILAEPVVSVVDQVVDKKRTREVAEAYLQFLYTPTAQAIIAKRYYRPIDPVVLKQNQHRFPSLKLDRVDDVFGGWQKAQEVHFKEGGVFDQIIGRK
jgi:sulfate/thiosulfate-binding protein